MKIAPRVCNSRFFGKEREFGTSQEFVRLRDGCDSEEEIRDERWSGGDYHFQKQWRRRLVVIIT